MAGWPYNTARWQRLRLAKLASQPVCEPCGLRGAVTLANTVDHVTPVNAGGDPFPPLDGLMGMCERCHNEKTAAHDRRHKKPFARRIKGFDLSGNPADPCDDWHGGGGGSNHQNGSAAGPMGESRIYLVSPSQPLDSQDDSGFA